jgi:predicted ATPase/DNA-binding SARP family transcriptional activator
MSALEFRVLGPLEVLRDGEAIELGAAKQRALLAVLLLHTNKVVPVDRLIDDLWGERQPDTAANALQVYISGLRKVLGRDRLITRRPGYLLEVGVDELDALQFEEWAAHGRAALERGEPAAALHHLASALSLWRGPALADFAYEPFAAADAARLEELRISAIEDRVDADLALGRHREVVGTLDGLVTEHPLRERLSGQRMLALYRSGRQADALRAYQSLRKRLAEELGIDPSPALQQLEAAVLAQDPALDSVGVQASAAASEATEERPLPAAFHRRDRVPFVGRDDERARLTSSWAEATRGSLQLVWLSGEPGIGKTRLAIEFGAAVAGEGAIVLHGRCEEDIGLPYQPFVEALGQYVAWAPDDVLEAHVASNGGILGRVVPELERRVGRPPEAGETDPAVDRHRLFDATAALSAAASRQAPVLVFLDDLHWADKPTLLLLRHLVRWHGPAAVLVVASYRDTEIDDAHPLRSVAADLSHDPGVERVTLSGLGADDVAALVEAAAGQHLTGPQSAVAYVLAHETEGNPFFVREILRHLVETGRITGGPDGWPPDLTVEQLGIPQAVKDVIGLRVGRLSPSAQTTLTMAAVIGRGFDIALLARLVGGSDDDLVTAIEEAEASRLIVESSTDPGTYTFAHALIRETLYASVSGARRGQLHGRVAAAIEDVATSGDAPVGELSYHYAHSVEPDLRRAIEYSRRAAEVALGKLAYEEAATQLERALAAADAAAADPLLRYDILLTLGDAQWKAGEEASSRASFRAAADLARQVGDTERLAMAAVGAAGLGFEGAEMYDDPVPLLEEALGALGPEQSVLRARVLAAYARATIFVGDADTTRAASREALATARRLGDRRTLIEVLAAWFWVGWGDDADDAAAAADELLSLTESLPDLHYRAEAHICRLLSRLQLGRRDEAMADIDALRELSRATAHDRYRWYSLSWDATIAVMEGRFADAKQLAQDAVSIGFPLRGPAAAIAYMTQLSLVFWAEGALGDVLAGVDSSPELEGSPLQDTVLTFLLAESGRLDEALASFASATAGGFDQYSGMSRLPAVAFLANASATLGIADHAAELYERLLPDQHCHVVIPRWLSGGVVTGPVPYFLGRLRHLLGDPAGAIPHYERALVMNEELHSWPSQARVQLDLAAALLDLPEPDATAAAVALAAGRAIVEQVGMPQVGPYLEGLERRVAD